MGSLQQIVLFVGVLLSLAGLEMSAIHAKDVKNPQKNYPKAILLSAIIILTLSILGVITIASVVPKGTISLVAGSLQAFASLLEGFGLQKLMPLMALTIAVGAIGSLSTWAVGPSRGLLVAAQSGDLPPFFRKINKHNMPVNLMVVQAIIVSGAFPDLPPCSDDQRSLLDPDRPCRSDVSDHVPFDVHRGDPPPI